MIKKIWTAKEIALLRKVYGRLTSKELERIFQCNHSSIRSAACRCKIVSPNLKFEKYREEFQRLYDKGHTDMEISRRLSIPRATVLTWRRKLKLSAHFKPGFCSKEKRTEAMERMTKTKRKQWRWEELQKSEEKKRKRGVFSPLSSIRNYSNEESEFLKAIDAFRGEHHRIPTLLEGLHIAKGLGWQQCSS